MNCIILQRNLLTIDKGVKMDILENIERYLVYKISYSPKLYFLKKDEKYSFSIYTYIIIETAFLRQSIIMR